MFNKKSYTIKHIFYIFIVIVLTFFFISISIFFSFSDNENINFVHSNSILDSLFYDKCFSENYTYIEAEKFDKISINNCLGRFFSENFYGKGAVLSLKILNEKYESIPSKSFYISSTEVGISVKEEKNSRYSEGNLFFIKKGRLCKGEYLNERCFELLIPISYIEEKVTHDTYFLSYTLIFI